MRISFWGWRLWLPALAVLACLLGACSASPSAAPTPVSAPATVVTPTLAVASPTVIATLAPTAIATAAPATEQSASSAVGAASAATATVAATAAAATATPDPAVAAILAYLDARARGDVGAVTGLSCKAWKPKAVTEAVSFRSMNAKMVGVTCQVNGSAGSFTLVGCGGKMVTTYGTESRDWDLSAFVYEVIAEDGQWKMCGYH